MPAAPSPFTSELTAIDDDTLSVFDLPTDAAAKVLNALIETVKCGLDVLDEILNEGELGSVYKKFRSEVEAILKDDVKQCLQTEKLVEKLK